MKKDLLPSTESPNDFSISLNSEKEIRIDIPPVVVIDNYISIQGRAVVSARFDFSKAPPEYHEFLLDCIVKGMHEFPGFVVTYRTSLTRTEPKSPSFFQRLWQRFNHWNTLK